MQSFKTSLYSVCIYICISYRILSLSYYKINICLVALENSGFKCSKITNLFPTTKIKLGLLKINTYMQKLKQNGKK